MIKKLNYYKRCGIKYSNATNDNWHNYIKEDYFLKGHMKRSHKKDVEIVIKMLAEHGARLDGCHSAKILDKIKFKNPKQYSDYLWDYAIIFECIDPLIKTLFNEAKLFFENHLGFKIKECSLQHFVIQLKGVRIVFLETETEFETELCIEQIR
jgi:hypothetical protein